MPTLARGTTLVIAIVLAGGAVLAGPPGEFKAGVRGSEPTAEGVWDGTWIYVNRDAHFALWIRTKDGKPQVKIQYQSLASPEAFETDWSGMARYYMAGSPAEFALALDEADAERITGRWSWEIAAELSARRESATVALHRTGHGRNISMTFRDYVRTVTQRGQDHTIRAPMSWTWIKVSKRELLWDELPW